MAKKLVKLTEGDLHRIIKESVKKMINEIDYSNFDFSKTDGIDLSDIDPGYAISPREIKEKVKRLQDALKDVMDLTNGNVAGKNFSREMWDECYNFYRFISKYYIELDKECRSIEGSWKEDHSDIPFIRKYTDDFGIPNYYGKDGNPIDRKSFRTDFKPNR
jgi:hypothetical protein